MDFELVGDLTDVDTIATGSGIRELPRLRRLYGKGRWRKMKGIARIRLRDGRIRLTELHRYALIDPNTINYEVTVEDPNVFSRPWKMSMPLYRHREKNFQLLEYECYGYAYEDAARK